MQLHRLKRLFSRKPRQPQMAASRHTMVEPLEGRQLLSGAAAVVTSTVADNRGLVQIRFSKTLASSTISKSTVRVFTPGADGLFNTPDDASVNETVSYSNSKKMIQISAPLPSDTPYRVKIYGSKVKDSDGLKIDGEFKTGGRSGNGVQGGDYNFRARRDTGATPVARFSGPFGDLDVLLFRGASSQSTVATPLNVANFLKYANAGDWDNVVINRLLPGFVAQLGAHKVSSTGQFASVTSRTTVGSLLGEPGNTNATGTLAFALSAGPNTATDEFFFNLGNNNTNAAPNNLDESAGGGPFTVFAKVANSKGMAILNAINALHRLNVGNDSTNLAVRSTVPVTGETSGTGGTTTKASFNLFEDLALFSRVSVLTKIVSVT